MHIATQPTSVQYETTTYLLMLQNRENRAECVAY